MFGKKKKKVLTKQERRIASSVNTKPKKSFKKNKTKANANNSIKTKINDFKDKTNYAENPMQGFYVDKATRNNKNPKEHGEHISWQLSADDKTWTRIGPLTHETLPDQRYILLESNPNPNDKSPSYLRKYIRTSKIGTRGRYVGKYSMSSNDNKKVIEYAKNKKNT